MAPSTTADGQTLIMPPVDSDQASTLGPASDDGDSRFEVEALQRARRSQRAIKTVALIFATLSALCGGSITVFSLYAPVFQSRLHYTQFQVNGVAIGSSVALYLPISVLGYICDRAGVKPLAVMSALLLGGGYGLAALVFRKLDIEYNSLGRPHGVGNEWSYPLMVLAFVCIGGGTSAIYMASVSTCAKNFGKGKYRGLALAMPITGFGLSGMWLSQAGSRLFPLKESEAMHKGEVDVFRFFVFLAVLLFVVSVADIFTLRVANEQDLIEEAIEELEHSGLLDGGSLIGRSDREEYGTLNADESGDAGEDAPFLEPSKDDDARWKKNWVLNAETRRFLSDRTMWPFALAFLLMIGPGEAFVNNLGTVIGTLTPPATADTQGQTTVATHVSIFGVTSTISRVLIGTLTDLLAPSPQTQHVQISSLHLPPQKPARRFTISRIVFLLFFAVLLSIGLLFLAAGAAQNHPERFWVVSGLVGAGYGAIFSLVPLIVTIIWGVENFATNFGIIAMLPAVGSTFWGLVYSAVYQAGARESQSAPGTDDNIFCYGKHCYSAAFWAQGISVVVACLVLCWTWLGRGGWAQRGIVI